MKIISACVASAIVLFSMTGTQAARKELVFRVFTDVVDPVDQQAFEAAIKSYGECLGQQKFMGTMRAYGSETGDTYKYTFVMGLPNWAELDGARDTVRACDKTWRSAGNAHLKSETSLILSVVPELSYLPRGLNLLAAKPALVQVTSFVLKNGSAGEAAFTDGIRKLRDSADKANWPGHFIAYQVHGGSSIAPAYVLISTYKGWTEYGAGAGTGGSSAEAWKMFESANGKVNADALRKSIADTVAKTSSHVDSYIENLSYVPSSDQTAPAAPDSPLKTVPRDYPLPWTK